MSKKILLSFLSLLIISLFSACSSLIPKVKDDTKSTELSTKSFDAEDVYIMYALRAEEIGDSVGANELFQTLYDKSAKKEYLYKALRNQITLQKNQEVIDQVDKVTLGSIDDFKLTRFKIVALFQLKEDKQAQKIATALVTKSDAVTDYLLLSDIYTKEGKYESALKSLEDAYLKNYDEKIVDKISIIMYVSLNRKKDAIAQLETHSRMRGCSELICNRLIGFYSKENDIDGIVATYLRMYETTKNETIAKKIIQIYNYQKKYSQMILFLEKYNLDEETLLQLYTVTKDYKKAFVLANKLYENSGNLMYLGQSAIFEYESVQKNSDKKVLQNVIEKLEEVVKKNKNPLYENYLGYVLIDHDIDIKKGMKHIENVLVVQPDSAYYLDSLAWGYYKLHQCSKAKTIMDKVVTLEGGDDPEVLEHVQSINRCVKTKKGKNK